MRLLSSFCYSIYQFQLTLRAVYILLLTAPCLFMAFSLDNFKRLRSIRVDLDKTKLLFDVLVPPRTFDFASFYSITRDVEFGVEGFLEHWASIADWHPPGAWDHAMNFVLYVRFFVYALRNTRDPPLLESGRVDSVERRAFVSQYFGPIVSLWDSFIRQPGIDDLAIQISDLPDVSALTLEPMQLPLITVNYALLSTNDAVTRVAALLKYVDNFTEQDTALAREYLDAADARPSYATPALTCDAFSRDLMDDIQCLHRAMNVVWRMMRPFDVPMVGFDIQVRTVIGYVSSLFEAIDFSDDSSVYRCARNFILIVGDIARWLSANPPIEYDKHARVNTLHYLFWVSWRSLLQHCRPAS